MEIKAVIDPNRSRPVPRPDTHSHAIGDKHRVKASFKRPRQAALLMATRPLGSSPGPQVRFNCQTRVPRGNSALVRNHRQEEGRADHQEPLSNSRVWRCSPWLGVHPRRRLVCSDRIENEGLRTATQSSQVPVPAAESAMVKHFQHAVGRLPESHKGGYGWTTDA